MKKLLLSTITILTLLLTGCATGGHPTEYWNQLKAEYEQAGSPIMITDLWATSNSANGISLLLSYDNYDSRTIKYATFGVHVENAVGDIISSSIGGKKLFILQDTGPVPQNTPQKTGWATFMYNSTAKTVIIDSVTLEFMNGETLGPVSLGKLRYTSVAIK